MDFLRRLFSHKKSTVDKDHHHAEDKKTIKCTVVFLDDTTVNFVISKKDLARILYEKVYSELDFQAENDYFALQFTDFNNIRHWLDPTKLLKKQIKSVMPGPPYSFRFVVKFFSSEPDQYLREELTRYLFVQQLRKDLAEGKLRCSDDEKAAELAALFLQSELGDFDENEHTPATVSEFRYLPEHLQTEEFELMVFEDFQKLSGRNLTPALCERTYLNKVKYFENYGVDMHDVRGKDNRSYHLGLTPAGILIYEGNDKIGLFFWPRIIKLDFNKSRLKIVVTEDDTQGVQQDHTFVFNLPNTKACKHLWRCAVEHHTFFRLVETKQPPSKRKQILRLRSRFYHSFRTESGMVQANQFGSSTRRSARFERRPSTRYSSRPSFARADAQRRRMQDRDDLKTATLERLKDQEERQKYNSRTSERSHPSSSSYGASGDTSLTNNNHTIATKAVVNLPSPSTIPSAAAGDVTTDVFLPTSTHNGDSATLNNHDDLEAPTLSVRTRPPPPKVPVPTAAQNQRISTASSTDTDTSTEESDESKSEASSQATSSLATTDHDQPLSIAVSNDNSQLVSPANPKTITNCLPSPLTTTNSVNQRLSPSSHYSTTSSTSQQTVFQKKETTL